MTTATTIVLRIITSILLIIIIPITPWWLWILLAVGSILFWTNLYEIIVICFVLDLVYGVPPVWWWYPATIIAPCILIMIELLKTRLTVYRRS